ncbi:glycosyltransferase [Denitromonas iodatirespirans]|uniref:Glycosyltransferase n=1 Tax=Denitromonas iodatirespirans TaxID=2795389 RepID=A0A944HBT6_DENI1|nr:glycosyltransferase [Denitromonas iodatirespirans]MBT0960581.1 glycosyltransferase [Denitromonas iodatirespirans]
MKRLLMIAYHFPPIQGSSGVQRSLRFIQHLPEFGWEPIVLSITPCAYPATSDDQLAQIPAGTVVCRAFGLDAARHLSIAGRYPGWLALPDRWANWQFAAAIHGRALIRRHRPQALWSTYPIATAHRIAAGLQQHSGLPWLADFRDPMAQPDYPADPAQWRAFKRIEESAARQAAAFSFTAPSALADYRQRYPDAAARMHLIENGYDEAAFADEVADEPLTPGHLTLLHSGIVYPQERDPTQLFAALATLRRENPALTAQLRLRFRAPVHEDLIRHLAATHDLTDLIEVLPPLPYRDAIAEMQRADGLLVLQAGNCNHQIPAKLYEYLRARRPILGLADPAGDTGRQLAAAGVPLVVPLEQPQAIREALGAFLTDPARRALADEEIVAAASRRQRTAQLAKLLDRMAS